MANVITPTYSFTLPEVGADTNAWGGHLNANFQTIDNQMVSRTLVTAQNIAGPLNLPANGLNVGSGQLNVTGGNVAISGGLTVNSTLSVTAAAVFGGAATASFTPTLGSHLTNKTYVDTQDALSVLKAGSTMTGLLVLSGDPAVALGAATKQYVDGRSITAGTGLTGGGTLGSSPTISIAPGGVTATQLAADAVTTAKILNGNVTPAKLAQPFTQMTEQTASGTTVQFTGIPSWARKITITFDGVINGSTGSPMIQIGPSGGVEATGYSPYIYIVQGGSASTNTSGFVMPTSGVATLHGHIVLTNPTGNEWIMSMMLAIQGSNNIIGGGKKALAGVLDRVLFKHLNGADSFGGGTINVQYE